MSHFRENQNFEWTLKFREGTTLGKLIIFSKNNLSSKNILGTSHSAWDAVEALWLLEIPKMQRIMGVIWFLDLYSDLQWDLSFSCFLENGS